MTEHTCPLPSSEIEAMLAQTLSALGAVPHQGVAARTYMAASRPSECLLAAIEEVQP